jgi:hypothetical protein
VKNSDSKNRIKKTGFKNPDSQNQIQKTEYKNPDLKTGFKTQI